jgi:hypothetical protein
LVFSPVYEFFFTVGQTIATDAFQHHARTTILVVLEVGRAEVSAVVEYDFASASGTFSQWG